MSDAITYEAVVKQFDYDPFAMADEIVRLRNLTAADHIAALVAMGAERGLASQMYYDADVLYLPPEMTT